MKIPKLTGMSVEELAALIAQGARRPMRALALASLLNVVLPASTYGEIPFSGLYEGDFGAVDDSDPTAVIFESLVQESTNASPNLAPQLDAIWFVNTTVTPFEIFDGSSIFTGVAGELFVEFPGTATADPGNPAVTHFDVPVVFTGGTVNGQSVPGGSGNAVGQLNSATGFSSGTIDGTIIVSAAGTVAVVDVPSLSPLGIVALIASLLGFAVWRWVAVGPPCNKE